MGQGLVGIAALTGEEKIVNDVRQEPVYRPIDSLPETRSEVVIPIKIENRVLGVLDVQSDHLNAFSDEDVNIQLTLAAQVATALQNARSFARAQRLVAAQTHVTTSHDQDPLAAEPRGQSTHPDHAPHQI